MNPTLPPRTRPANGTPPWLLRLRIREITGPTARAARGEPEREGHPDHGELVDGGVEGTGPGVEVGRVVGPVLTVHHGGHVDERGPQLLGQSRPCGPLRPRRGCRQEGDRDDAADRARA